MALLTSIVHEKFRKIFLIFFILSSTVPMLFMIYVIFQHVIPVLTPDQIADLKSILTYGVLVMLLPAILSFAMGFQWFRSIETLTNEITSKSIQMIGRKHEFKDQNELSIIHQSFNELHDELQNKMAQLQEASKKLMDSNIKLNELATTDELTSVYNRRYFNLRLIEETNRSDRYKQALSLIMIDLDDFKRYNDTYGHQAGDQLLCELSDLIKKSIRKSDMIFRYGGDEFAVLVQGCDINMAEHIAQELVKKVSDHQIKNIKGIVEDKITISCGVACYNGNMEEFVTEADQRLLTAKSAGKGLVVSHN